MSSVAENRPVLHVALNVADCDEAQRLPRSPAALHRRFVVGAQKALQSSGDTLRDLWQRPSAQTLRRGAAHLTSGVGGYYIGRYVGAATGACVAVPTMPTFGILLGKIMPAADETMLTSDDARVAFVEWIGASAVIGYYVCGAAGGLTGVALGYPVDMTKPAARAARALWVSAYNGLLHGTLASARAFIWGLGAAAIADRCGFDGEAVAYYGITWAGSIATIVVGCVKAKQTYEYLAEPSEA